MGEILKLWDALETKIPTKIANAVMLLPSLKSCLKYLFLEEIDNQCRSLCVRKHNPSILHVSRQDTKASLENFNWLGIMEEMKTRAPDLLDFIATVSVPVVKEKGNQIPPVCVAYAVMMHTHWRELSLVQKVMTFILGIGHSTSKVNQSTVARIIKHISSKITCYHLLHSACFVATQSHCSFLLPITINR